MKYESALRAAGYNIIHLRHEDIAHDLFSDAHHDFPVPEIARAGEPLWAATHQHVDVESVLREVFGDFYFALTIKGRAAEMALVGALAVDAPLVLTHGLFSSTMRALATRRARVEMLPLAAARGTADVDPLALAQRLAQGGVHLVYLEVANNGLCGWPVAEDKLAAVRRLCDAHGAQLWLDATRLLANCALSARDPWPAARRMLALSHAFTIAGSKEFLVPRGSLCASTDAALIGRAVMNVFQNGSGLESAADRSSFAAGLRHVAADPSSIVTRTALVKELAALLAERHVAVVQPAGAHAVFVEVPQALLARFGPLAPPVLLAQVFASAGVRCQPVKWGEQLCLRFALPTVRVQASALIAIADAIQLATEQLGEARALRPLPEQAHVLPFEVRFELA
jgi:tryptophanase